MTSPNLPPPLPGQSGRSPVLVVSLCVAGALLVLGVGVAVGFLTRGGLVDRGVDDEKHAGAPDVDDEKHAGAPDVDEEEQRRREEEQQELDQAEQARKKKELEDDPRKKPVAKNGEKAKKPPVRNRDLPDPLKDIKARGKILVLPETNQADLLSAKASQRHLATLYTKQLRECNLKLVAGLIAKPGVSYTLVELPSEEQRRRTWSVTRAARADKGVGDEKPKVTRIGTFEIKSAESGTEQLLYFSWDKGVPPTAPSVVRLMDLEVIVGQQSAVCELDKPKVLKAITVEFGNNRELGVNLNGEVGRHIRQHAADVFLDVRLVGFEPEARVQWTGLGRDARNWHSSIAKAAAMLKGIRMEKARIEVQIVRENRAAVSISLVFTGPRNDKPPKPASLDATWTCLVPNNIGDNIFSKHVRGFSLEDARKGPAKTGALIKQRRGFIDKLKKEQSVLKRRVSQLQATLNKTENSQQRAALTLQREVLQNRFNAIPGFIRVHEATIRKLEISLPYQKALIVALEKHNKRCGIEWRIYLSKGGREKTLAISAGWLPEKRPAR